MLVVALPVGASYSTVLPMQRLVSLEARARSLESLVTVRSELWVNWTLPLAPVLSMVLQPQHDRLLARQARLGSPDIGRRMGQGGDNDRTDGVSDVLKSIETIKVGMTRQELRRVSQPKADIVRPSAAVHTSRCAYIKVDVEFAPTTKASERTANRPDRQDFQAVPGMVNHGLTRPD